MTSDALLEICLEVLDDRQAQDILAYDVRGTSVITDYFIICSGNSTTHIQALMNHLRQALKDQGVAPRNIEGVPVSNWIVLDCIDVLVHIFHPETRAHYQIEKLLDPEQLVHGEPPIIEDDDDDPSPLGFSLD